MVFLLDKEINLNKQDLLRTAPYSKALKEVIVNSPSDNSFTIGLFGEWGSGKSSIVKTVQEEFNEASEIKFVVYDAWKYSNDSFRRMFLLKLQESLGFEKKEKFESFYRNKSSDVSVTRRVDWKYLILTVLALFFGIILVYVVPKNEFEAKITLALIVAFLGILINVLGRAFSDYKVTVQEPMIFAPEQFEECFNEMIPKIFQKDNALTKISKWVNGQEYVTGLDKLIIVIDNIDRCPKDKAYEMITNIKSFLSAQKKVVFLIPVDDEALKRHIVSEENNDYKEAEEFLRKFFSVTIRIKPFKRFDLYDFTNNINKDYNLNFNPTTIDIVSKEYATNPRRIIQFFNDLMSELKIFELTQGIGFAKENESLICKMLIIRQEWPDYYKLISKNASLINDFEGNPQITKMQHENEELKSFMNVTNSITRNENISIMETVLSTFDRQSKLSTELISVIEKKAIEEISKMVLENRVDKTVLINYLIERLNTGIKRKTYKTDVNNTFEILSNLDAKFNLEKDQNIRIASEVQNYLDKFFTDIADLDLLISYGHKLKSMGLSYLDDFTVRHLEIGIYQKEEHYRPFVKDLFRKYIAHKESREKLGSLEPLFEREFHISAAKLADYGLTGDQLSSIVNDEVLSTMVSRIKGIDDKDEGFIDIVFASNNIAFSVESFAKVISRLSELVPGFANTPKDKIIQHLELLNSFLKHQKGVAIEKPQIELLLELKSKMLSNRVHGAQYINILTEQLTIEEVKVLSYFLKYIYVCSNGGVEILSNLKMLNTNSERTEIINERLIELFNENKGYRLFPIKEFILNDETCSDTSIALNEFILTRKNGEGVYDVKDDEAYQKIERMIKVFESTKATNINNFFDRIIEDQRAKGLLATLVVKMTRDNILKLPKKIQVLTFDKISEGDMIYEYSENNDFLKVVASLGEKKHIAKVVKIVVSKIQRQDEVTEGIDILNEVKELKASDKKIIEGIVEGMEDGENKERATEILKKL